MLIPVSLNSSQRDKEHMIRAGKRKKRMSAVVSMTFLQLMEEMDRRVAAGEISATTIPNLKSALRAFLKSFGMSEQAVIGSVLRRSALRNLRLHIEGLKAEGRDSAYIANRKSLLSKWFALVNEIDRVDAITNHRKTPLQLALDEILAKTSLSASAIAKAAGVSKASFRRWLNGANVQQRALPSLRRLERFFAIEAGSLVRLASNERIAGSPQEESAAAIKYRERLAVAAKDPYRLKKVSASLREEWRAFLVHKTEKIPVLKRQSRGAWATTAVVTDGETEQNWFAFVDGRHVPTAAVVWAQVASYLGWLSREKALGGAGMNPDETQTLAWLANKPLVHAFLNWMIRRADNKAHNGVVGFAKQIATLTHPKHGYLTQKPEILHQLPCAHQPDDWFEHCTAIYGWASEMHQTLTDNGIEQSREPTEPIKDVLALNNPLEAVADMIVRMKSEQPVTGGGEEAVWARDVLLVKLLASNPLRAKNLKLLTYRSDNTGKLYRPLTGGWAIRIPKEEFKNAKGAAKEREYHMPVDASVWPEIESYLKTYRPMLPDADKVDYVFLSSMNEKPEGYVGVWKSLNRRIFKLTRQFLWKCPGIGSHAFRYIVATSILKQSPGEWDTAASVLHDKVETVKKHYAHLKSADGAVRMYALLSSTFARM